MRKLFHTAAAIAALLALSMAANAAEVGARPPVYTPPPIYVAPALQLDWILPRRQHLWSLSFPKIQSSGIRVVRQNSAFVEFARL